MHSKSDLQLRNKWESVRRGSSGRLLLVLLLAIAALPASGENLRTRIRRDGSTGNAAPPLAVTGVPVEDGFQYDIGEELGEVYYAEEIRHISSGAEYDLQDSSFYFRLRVDQPWQAGQVAPRPFRSTSYTETAELQ